MTEMDKHNDDDTVHRDESSGRREPHRPHKGLVMLLTRSFAFAKARCLVQTLVVRDLIDEGRR